MVHYVNDYSKIWKYIGELEKEKLALNTTKFSLEVEVIHLNEVISKERKKWARVEDQEKELIDALTVACHELSEDRGRLDVIAQESVVAYKASEECAQERSRLEGICFGVLPFW